MLRSCHQPRRMPKLADEEVIVLEGASCWDQTRIWMKNVTSGGSVHLAIRPGMLTNSSEEAQVDDYTRKLSWSQWYIMSACYRMCSSKRRIWMLHTHEVRVLVRATCNTTTQADDIKSTCSSVPGVIFCEVSLAIPRSDDWLGRKITVVTDLESKSWRFRCIPYGPSERVPRIGAHRPVGS